MSVKHYLKIVVIVASVVFWQGTLLQAGQKEKPKSKALQSSIQVPPSEKDEAKLQAAAKITAEDAKKAALKAHKGSAVKYVAIRNLKGNLVYEVEFQDEKEYMIDAGTGELLKKSQEGTKK